MRSMVILFRGVIIWYTLERYPNHMFDDTDQWPLDEVISMCSSNHKHITTLPVCYREQIMWCLFLESVQGNDWWCNFAIDTKPCCVDTISYDMKTGDNPHHGDDYTAASRITSDYAMNDSQDYQPASKQYCSDITSPCQRYYIHFDMRPCYQISKYCWLYFAHLLDTLRICDAF